MELSPPIISSGAPSLNFEVLHQVLELHYNTSPASQSQFGEHKDRLWHTTSVYKNKGRITKNSCWLQSHTDGRGTVRAALLSNSAGLARHQAWQTLVFQYICSLLSITPLESFGTNAGLLDEKWFCHVGPDTIWQKSPLSISPGSMHQHVTLTWL